VKCECQNCGWIGDDDELLEEIHEGKVYSYVCPECESDDLFEDGEEQYSE